MPSSISPISRTQFANSMPPSTHGCSSKAAAPDEAAALASSASCAAMDLSNPRRTASSDGVIAPHRPAMAKTKPVRLAPPPSPPSPQPPQQQAPHKKEKKLLHGKMNSAEALTSHDSAARTHHQGRATATATGFAATTTAGNGAHSSASSPSDTTFPFDVYPPTVVFDSYAANTTYTAALELRNHTAFNKHVRIDRPNACTAFELTVPRGAKSSSKVAPGLSVTYTVVFTPASSTKDYEVDLVVRTDDDEPLIVPVRAYASRGCLHLPSALTLKEAPIKGSSTTPLFLRNTSERDCVWRAVIFDTATADPTSTVTTAAALRDSASSLSSCFAITPRSGVVSPFCTAGGQAVAVAPVTLCFCPNPRMTAAGACHGLLRFFLGPEGDVVQDVHLTAQAVELHGIVLETEEVTLADTYVTTERQTVVRVRNESDETITFAWKSSFCDTDSQETGDALENFGNGDNDHEHEDGVYDEERRSRRRSTRPSAAATHKLLSDEQRLNHATSSDVAATNSTQRQDDAQQRHDQTLSDLYEGDESFQIQPLSGVLYGRGVREFTITFNPHLAVPYESVAYLDVTGSVKRLPLLMRGRGVGPLCKLEYSRLDIGDVYLNAVHEYFVTMENTSAIECQFIIMPPVPVIAGTPSTTEPAVPPAVDFASKFRFTPSHGSLAPGEAVRLRIELKSDRIGSFAETFHVHMQGAVEEVPLLLKGRVLGPHFQCDVDELDFGNVSYNMEHVRTMNIENTSPIPMRYMLHLPDDCAYASDFVITPAEGVIAPLSAEAVQVRFRSRTVGDYETALLVEVADVGDVLDAIPLKATCMVPTLRSSTTELTYGGVFVGYPTTLNVAISNDTALTGMFDLQLLNGEALTDVVVVELPVSSEHDDGLHWIAPHQTLQLPMTLTALRPGRLHFSLALHVLGRDMSEPAAPPLTILVSAVASGPHVELQPSGVQFGTLDVLTEEVRELTLKNTSPVPAPFALVFDRYGAVHLSADSPTTTSTMSAALEGGDAAVLAESTLPFPRVPVFSVEPAEGVLEPHSSLTVRVRAKPDDAVTFVDTLRLRRALAATPEGSEGNNDSENNNDNGDTSTVATTAAEAANTAVVESDVTAVVKVTGQGVPILADRALESIDLGDVLTTLPVAETVTLHNYGRREQEVQWHNTRGNKVKEGEPPITFSYRPERASIPAGGSAVFTLCGSSAEVGARADTLTLKQSGTFKEVLRSTVKATFIAPTLSYSSRAINFEYANTAAATMTAPSLVKSLTMKNITSKTFVIALCIKGGACTTPSTNKAATTNAAAVLAKGGGAPFALEGPATVTLHSGESYVVGVRCNPLYRGDCTSHTAKAKLQLSFAEHDRVEFVNLTATLHFPSVELNPSSVVDFGTVLTNTEQRRSIELHNPSSDLPASFRWSLRPHASAAATTGAVEDALNAASASTSPTEAKPSVNVTGDAALPSQSALSAATTAKANDFDIIPFSGTLLPGEKRIVEVAYQGADVGAAVAVAVCHVEGGPTYTVELRAAANVVQAHCDKNHIDFGRLPYYESASKTVTLTNTTQVHVPWQVDLSKLRHPACLRVSPLSGILRDKVRLQITFTPQAPDAFEEDVWVCIGHLDPKPIHISGSGYMNSVAIVTTTSVIGAPSSNVPAATANGPMSGGQSNGVQVYRAPFGAFIQALEEVEARLAPSNSLPPSLLPSSTTLPKAAAATVEQLAQSPVAAAAPAELPAVLRQDWAILEAERLAFCRAVRERAVATDPSTTTAATGGEGVVGPPLFLSPRTLHRNSVTAQSVSGSSSTKLVLARYVVDFGHLTRDDVRKARLSIANPSSDSVNVVLDSKELASLPISVEPAKGFKVAARETTTIELTMDATKPESVVPHGENVHEFTLDVKNGPAVVVECRCYVATPSLRAKEKEVNFGAVLVGEVKVLPLVLTNPEAVACPWRVTCKEAGDGEAALQGRQSSKAEMHEDESSVAAEEAIPEFWVRQDHGVVPASGSLTIEVYYAPKNFRAKKADGAAAVASAAQLKFRCGAGAAVSFLTVKLSGTPRDYQLHFSSELLHLPPARPHQVLQESVTLTNDEDYSVEVFNAALDARHANEVQLLRRALEGSESKEVFLPPIRAGEYLPDTLLESVFAQLHLRSDALTEQPPAPHDATGTAAAAAGAASGGTETSKGNSKVSGAKTRGSFGGLSSPTATANSDRGSPRGVRKESRRASVKAVSGGAAANQAGGANAQGVGAADGGSNAAHDAEVSGVKPSLLLLVGPPRSGKTSVAQHWLSCTHETSVNPASAATTDAAPTVMLVDVDALIRAEAERDDTANAAVARCLLTNVAEEAAGTASGTAEAASVAAVLAGDSNQAAGRATKVASPCEALVPALIRDLLQLFLTNSIQAVGKSAPSAVAAARPLRFVMDGLSCDVLANQWTLYEVVCNVCAALRIPVHVISLHVSTPMSNVRAARALAAHHEARVAAASLTPLGEAAYEALSREAREDYNRRLKYMNDCRRDLQAAQREQRAWASQLPHVSVQEELEDSLRHQQTEAALESTTRSTKTQKGAPTRRASEDQATGLDETEWRALDAAAQFSAWYRRFLLQHGCPPSTGDEKPVAAVASGRPAGSSKTAAAPAGAGGAPAQDAKMGWSQVLRVNAETDEPKAVAEDAARQLAGLSSCSDSSNGGGSAAERSANSNFKSATAGASVTGANASSPQSNELSPKAGEKQKEKLLAKSVVSQLGEWFYLNEARLRSWSAEPAPGARFASVGTPSRGGGGVGDGATTATAEPGMSAVVAEPVALAAVAAAAAAATDGSSPATNGAAKTAVDAPHCYVRFFSMMEREMVPAKKTNSKKSVASVVLQKEEVTRWTLPPHSSVTLTLEFCSDHVGKFAERCVFGVVGSLQQLCLTVSAAVALPDISREAKDIFPVVRPRVGGGGGAGAGATAGGARRMPKVFIVSKGVFDFGALLVALPPTAKGRRRSGGGGGGGGTGANTAGTAEKASPSPSTAGRVGSADHPPAADSHGHANTPSEETLSFVNREPAEAEVTLSFTNDKEKTFTVSPTSFTLQPGATQQVQLRANPEKPGDFTNTLMASIKDNPVPWKVEVVCTGARPTLTVNGLKESLEADFGRLVLRRSVVKSFTLSNDGTIPLFWRLVPAPEAGSSGGRGGGGGSGGGGSSSNAVVAMSNVSLSTATSQWPAELQCSAMEGVLEEGAAQTLEITFAPTHPCLHNRTVSFLVCDAGTSQTIFETIPMTVKAEGYDVVVEWTRELQLGVLHVGEEKRETIRMMNKCPYEIGYQLRMPKRLQKVLTISTPSGTLRGIMGHKDAAIATIEVVARLDKEGELPAKLSMIEVAFFDVEKQELLYPLQTIPVYGEAWYTKYTVQPPSVSFGSCMVGQPRESSFELTNTGRFPIDFSLFNYREASAVTAAAAVAADGLGAVGAGAAGAAAQGGDAAQAGAENTSGQRRSLKSLKSVVTDFAVGAFTCRPAQGTVPIGGTQVITVSTVPSKQNRTHETVGVRVAQSGPELERYGTPVEISAYPAAPSIAADLASSTDVDTIFEEQRVVYRLDQLPKGARAYSTEERVFSFGTTLLGQRCEERFRIANSSPLTCAVAVQLESVTGSGSNSNNNNSTSNSAGGGGPGSGNGRRSVVVGNGGGGGDAARPEGFDIAVEGKGGVAAAQGKTSAVTFTLPPFESRFVKVAFMPTSLSRLQAQLVATVDSAATPNEERDEIGQKLCFGLCGEGTLPTVELLFPQRLTSPDAGRTRHSVSGTGEHLHGLDGSVTGDRKRTPRRRQVAAGSMSSNSLHAEGHSISGGGAAEVLEMPLTRLGAASTRSFTVRNTGCVEARVRVQLLAGSGAGEQAATSSNAFTMSAGMGAPQHLQDAAEPCRLVEILVPPGESEVVNVTYAPSQVESTTTRLRLTLVDNPFEDKEATVVARSFEGALSFEGIDPTSSDYVDVGDCYLGVDKTCIFSVRNNTDSLLRYVWEVPDLVRMSPSIGHLPAGATRAFTATLCSQTEGLGQRVCCTLHAQSIVMRPVNNGTLGGTGAMKGGVRTATSSTAAAAAGHTVTAAAAATATQPSGAVSDWDNSLQCPKWVLREDDADAHPGAAAYLSAAAAMVGRRNLKQVMEAVPEPPYTVVDELTVTQPLTMGYRCGVPTYHCQLVSGDGSVSGSDAGETAATPLTDVKAISFPHTYLLQRRVAVVRLTNTGSVALPYSCSITANAFSSGEKDTARDVQTGGQAPSWTAAQLSAAGAATGGAADNDSPTGERLPEPNLENADFAVTSTSWTAGDAASSDLHVVEAGSYAQLRVAFTPRTAGLLVAELLLRFPHSEPCELSVPLQGVAECPLVHFKVPPPSAASSVALRKNGLELSSFSSSAGTTATPLMSLAAGAGQGQEQTAEPVVVTFLARGLHTKATVRFPVVNPTSGSYSYEWIEEASNDTAAGADGKGNAGAIGAVAASGGAMSPFRCMTASGVVAAGRSVEAAFEFFADALGVRESTWSFRIPGRAIVPFRLIGTVVEPRVYFNASKVNFDHVQIGSKVEQTVVLENGDDVPYPFAWDKLSLEGMSTFLSVKPLRGTVAPRERLPVLLTFTPQEEVEYNVPLRCAVKKSSTPLSINVKGVGICVHDALQVEPADGTGAAETAGSGNGGDVVTVLRGQPLTLDLDRVQVNTSATRRFVLRNTGTYPFHYSVDTPANPCVSYDNAEGSVDAGQSAVMVLQYTPTAEETLKQCRLIFRIEGSVAYKVSVRAIAYLPRLRLSFDRYDFGPCFIAAYNNAQCTSLSEVAPADLAKDLLEGQPAGVVSQELQLTNVEAAPIAVQCGMATQNTWCKLDCTSLVVRPKETARLKLLFAPTETRHYEDVLELCLNKVQTTRLPIVGEGVAPRVEVANPFAKFGTVRVGESRSVEVRLQCLSMISTPVSFARAMDEDLESKGLSIALPGHSGSNGGTATAFSTSLVLKPKETVTVIITFAPTHRMSEFNREVKMLVCGVELPFVSVSGSCADAEVHLDTAHLVFRDIVIGASATRKVVILNSGDISQKFSWLNSLQQLKPAGEWTVIPSTGFVRAHAEVACEVRYTPGVQNDSGEVGRGNKDKQTKRKTNFTTATSSSSSPTLAPPQPQPRPPPAQMRVLKVEFDSAPSVPLSIDANAVTRPAATETVQFACRARESDTKMIEVENTTDQPWSAEPVVDNAVWSCPTLVTLKPLAKTAVAVTYNPTRSTLRGAAAGASRGKNPSTATTPTGAGNEGADKTRQSTAATAAASAAASPQPQKDSGFFFVPLPDGTGRCVALEGVAEAAGPAGPLQRYEAVAHMSLPLRFQVHNWSTTSTMCFRREVEWTSGPGMDGGEDGAAQAAMRVLESDGDSLAPQRGGGGDAGGSGATSRTASNSRASREVRKAGKKGAADGGTGAAAAAAASPALRGALEVPAKLSRESVLTVTPLREGVFRGVVRFVPIDKNGSVIAGEGMEQLFEVEVNAQPAPPAAPTVIELRAAIRDMASFSIPLSNPLAKPVEFTCKSSVVEGGGSGPAATASALEGLTLPTSVVVPAQSDGKAVATFFPLLCKKVPAAVQCVVTAPELGTNDLYIFRLSTTTETAAAERPVQVQCPLGQHVSFALRFTHYAKTNTEFAIRLNGEALGKTQTSFSRVGGGGGNGGQGSTVKVSAIHAPTGGAASPPRGQEVVVEFSYEPSEMGEEVATIALVSPVAGTYTFPVVATCTAPQRQGPFTARAGQNLQLPFRNVFSESVSIFVSSDSAAFVPVKKTETVPAHRTTNVVLQCKADEEKDVVRGRVSITCTPPGKTSQQLVEWLYYVEMVGGADRGGTGKQGGRKK